MSFAKVPDEISEKIFGYLNGTEFCNVKKVCKRWLNCTKEMELKEHWKTLCMREIPPYIIEELISCKKIPEGKSVIDWMSVYLRWYKGKIPASREMNIISNTIAHCPDKPIECVIISGCFLITGHHFGMVCIWNHETGALNQEFMVHTRNVTNLALIDLVNIGPYNLEGNLFFSHHHLVTGSMDCTFRIMSLLKPLLPTDEDMEGSHSTAVRGLKVFGNQLLVQFEDIICLHHLNMEEYPNLQCSLQKKIVGPKGHMSSVGLWHKEIYCVTAECGLYFYKDEDNTWAEEAYFKNRWRPLRAFTKCQTIRNKAIVLVSDEKQIAISLNKDKFTCYMMHDEISSIILKGTILAFGDYDGVLYLVSAPDNESLLNVAAFTCSICFDRSPIEAIDISFERDCPVIVACTCFSINVVKCYIPS